VKKLIVLLWLVLVGSAGASIDFKSTTDLIGLTGQVVDTNPTNSYLIPDSVRIVVTFHGMECLDAWYNAGDAEADSSNGLLTWYDVAGDIDADSGAGIYTVTAMYYNVTKDLYTNRYYQFYLGTQNTNVASVSDDALNLRTDICDVFPDSNIASITVADVNVGSVSSSAIEDADIATITVALAPEGLDADTSFTQLQALAATNLNATVSSRSTLAATDNIGVNFEDISGTLDSTELGATFWGGTIGVDLDDVAGTLSDAEIETITTNAAVTSIAQGAIDSGAISATAFWDLLNMTLAGWTDSSYAKLGHKLATGLDTSLFGFIDDWFLIDSTFADTAQMGVWMQGNIGTASSNWNDTQRDSVLAAIARLDDPLAANMTQVSGDAVAADNLETMLDGTGGATLSVGRVNATGANSTNGTFSITNSNGPATIFNGSTNALNLVAGTGDGLNVTSTAGDGFDVTAGTNGVGAKFTGNGSGDGVRFAGGSTGDGLQLTGSGTTGRGLVAIANGDGNAFDLIANGAGDGLDITSQTGDGIQVTAGGDAIQLVATGRDLRGEFDSANFASETFDSAHFTDKFFTNAQGAASGLDSTKVWGAAKQALTQGDFIWRSNQFIIKTDGSTNDTGAFAVYNSGSSDKDRAMSLQSAGANALYAYNSAGTTPTVRITGVGTQPALDVVNSGTGEAGKFTAAGNNALELTSAVSTAGVATLEISNTGEGIGTRIYADTGDALLLQVANNAVAGTNNALQIEGRSFIHNRGSAPYRLEDAVLIEGQRSGRALYLLSDSSTAFRISGDSGIVILSDSSDAGIIGILDSVVGVGSSGASGTDEATIRNIFSDTNPDPIRVQVHEDSLNAIAERAPALYYGPSGSGLGSGLYSVGVYALDTSGVDATISEVKVAAQDASGGQVAYGITDGTGAVTFQLDAGTYTVLARRVGYTFTIDTLTVSGNIDSTAVVGYDEDAGYVMAYINLSSGVFDSYGEMVPRADTKLTLQLIGESNLHDTLWAYFPKVQEKYPDAVTGEAIFKVKPNSLLSPAGSYYVLSATSFDGYSTSTSIIRKFVVDTLTDPINVLNTTEVW
jgi:hypothetical protein